MGKLELAGGYPGLLQGWGQGLLRLLDIQVTLGVAEIRVGPLALGTVSSPRQGQEWGGCMGGELQLVPVVYSPYLGGGRLGG